MPTAAVLSTEHFLDGLRRGDDEVVEQILVQCKWPIIHLLANKSATLAEAEDVFMDSLEALYMRLQKGPLVLKNCTFQTYLTTICLNQWRRKCRRKKFRANIVPEELTALRDNEDLEAALIEAERSRLFADALLKLGKGCQEVLRLALIEKYSLMEVGEQLGFTYDYARKKKSQCQRELIEHIKADGRFEELILQ